MKIFDTYRKLVRVFAQLLLMGFLMMVASSYFPQLLDTLPSLDNLVQVMDFEKEAEEKETEQFQLFKSSVVNCRTEQADGILLYSYLLRGNIPPLHLPEIQTPPPKHAYRIKTS